MRTLPDRALLPLLLLATATCGWACSDSQAAEDTAAAPPSGAQDAALTRVVTVEVRAEDLRRTISVPGSVRAFESVDLHALVGGYLTSIAVDLGDEVERGQVLAVVDAPELSAELTRREAEVEFARIQVAQQVAAVVQAAAAVGAAEADLAGLAAVRQERAAALRFRRTELMRWEQLLAESPSIQEGRVAEARFDVEAAEARMALVDADSARAEARIVEAQATVTRADADVLAARARVPVVEAELEELRTRTGFTQLHSPTDGVITERYMDPGDLIRAASTNSAAGPVLRIQRVDRVRVGAHLPMDVLAAVDVGDTIVFEHLAAAPGARFEGTLTRLSEDLGERSRMMRVEVELDNPRGTNGARSLRPGYYGDLTILLEELPATPTVPASALFNHDGAPSVYTVREGVVRRVTVEVVFQDGTRVGLGAGLAAGEQVLASGLASVQDGQRVRVLADGGR